MATIINNPDSNGNRTDGDGGMGKVIGAIVLILLLILLFVYGLPALRGGSDGGSGSGASIPEQVDVNVSAPSGGSGDTGGTTAQ
jgi:hypothetical protein